jgi:protein ImuB
LTPAPRADHRPEVRNGWAPADVAGCATPSRIEFANGERPFWLLQSPLPLPLRAHRPFYGSSLTLVRGPERIECGWWDGMPVMRDYFVAQSATAAFYWIYRQRDGEEVGWFLHGLFA